VPDPSLVLVPPGRAFASTWHFPLFIIASPNDKQSHSFSIMHSKNKKL